MIETEFNIGNLNLAALDNQGESQKEQDQD